MGDYTAWLPLTDAMAGSLPDPSAIRPEALQAGEERAQEIIYCVQPTVQSEKKRHRVIEYVRKLIGSAIDCEVFPFGSVPLKTYLPDGDIDLTALGNASCDSTLIGDVRCLLESEEDDEDAEFEIKDVQYINAEVRLIKCLIQNIIVDISFNQIGGLCTLSFLELVDCQIGKDHLFKRSILLIKAWCYYESRVLGAHHGLISTYALETLILYIFHLFHKSLDGPLLVLYRFLEYFSKFDWNTYCVSLYGPVVLSSLPNIVVEMRDIDSRDLLISKEFLKNSLEKFSVPPGDSGKSSPKFAQKHLNIIDPLRENNNLGRSVSKGNFYRIRSAFTYGARRLGRILMLPQECIADEISLFFMNTLERHGTGERPDLKDSFSSGSGEAELNATGFSTAVSGEFEIEKGSEGDVTSRAQSIDPPEELCQRISDMKVSTFDMVYELENCQHPVKILREVDSDVRTDEHLESGKTLAGEAQDLDINRMSSPKSMDENCYESPGTEISSSLSMEAQYGSYLLSDPENRDGFDEGSADSRTRNDPTSMRTTTGLNSYKLTASHLGTIQTPPFLSLSDFAGDLRSNLRYLRGVQYYLEHMFGGLLQSVQEVFPIQLDDETDDLMDESIQQSEFPQQSMFFHMDAKPLVLAPFPSLNAGMMCPFPVYYPYHMEYIWPRRGTGTYIPQMSYSTYMERVGLRKPPRSPNRAKEDIHSEKNLQHKWNRDPPPSTKFQISLSGGNDRGKLPPSVASQVSRPCSQRNSRANGFKTRARESVEFGYLGPLPLRGNAAPQCQGSIAANTKAPYSSVLLSGNERPKQTYQLKDDGDFPPLSG